jgi:acyl-CoA synthetase (AMP-forming)/AMP-acid ligase II
MRKFLDVFSTHAKLNPTVFHAAYGLAEHVIYVCDTPIGTNPLGTMMKGRVNCGTPRYGIDLRIVDPTTFEEVEDGVEGEIWINR